MPVYFAYTRDGAQFDATVALNAQNAAQIIRYRYTKNSGMHFVGGREQTTEELLNGMYLTHMPHITQEKMLIVHQRAEENAAVYSMQTLHRLEESINDLTKTSA